MKIKYTFVIYYDLQGEYRWKCLSSNGRKVADSGEGYKSKKAVMKFPGYFNQWVDAVKIIDSTVKDLTK